VPLLTEPKAIREPYSVLALAAPTITPKPSVELVKPADTTAKTDAAAKPADPAKAETPAIDAAKPQAVKPVPDDVKPDAIKPVAKPDEAKPVDTGDDEAIGWGWPAKGKVVAGFNDAASAKGIDIAGVQGQDVLAAAPGKVIYSGADLRGYGKLVIIKHNKTYLSVYAHNNLILVREGQQVVKGQKIAEMGSSDTDKVKLHFEIRRQGKSVDPAKYLAGNTN
jgi:lipoprotein NlpD